MKLEQMPRYPLLCGFTPLQRMENLEQALGCGPLYIKRDDLTPLGLGGNKTRRRALPARWSWTARSRKSSPAICCWTACWARRWCTRTDGAHRRS